MSDMPKPLLKDKINMTDIPKPQGDVLRRNAEAECGTPVGQVSVKVRGMADIQTISFYCNRSRFHTDECVFVGADVVVRKRRRDDHGSSIILSSS